MAYQFASVRRVAASPVSENPSDDPFVSRLLSTNFLTPDRAHMVAALQGVPRRVPAHAQLAHTGGSKGSTYVIREGWAFAYTLLANGERQIVGFLLPGDLIRIGCPARGNTDQGIEAITEMVFTEISAGSVRLASQEWPEIFVMFLRLQSELVSALVGQLVDIGRRDAKARVAQLLLKLERRLLSIGHAEADGYAFPVSQYLIADALGLTAIHVNRVLRSLREDGIVTLRHERVAIHDHARLMVAAGEEPVDDGHDGLDASPHRIDRSPVSLRAVPR